VALTEPRVVTPGLANDAPPRGFRPASRRRARVAGGVALIAAAIGGNILVYSSLDDRKPVLQVVRDVPAGEQLTSSDVRPIDVDADDTLRAVPAARLSTIVGQYTKVRLVAGSLVVAEALQPTPLVSSGAAVVAIQVPDGALPIGLRERSPVQLVVPVAGDGTTPAAPTIVDGRVVGLPTTPTSATGMLSLSVEVSADLAATVVASDDVRVVLVQPGADAAYASDIPTADDDGTDGP
jgi:hypothetical protein